MHIEEQMQQDVLLCRVIAALQMAVSLRRAQPPRDSGGMCKQQGLGQDGAEA